MAANAACVKKCRYRSPKFGGEAKVNREQARTHAAISASRDKDVTDVEGCYSGDKRTCSKFGGQDGIKRATENADDSGRGPSKRDRQLDDRDEGLTDKPEPLPPRRKHRQFASPLLDVALTLSSREGEQLSILTDHIGLSKDRAAQALGVNSILFLGGALAGTVLAGPLSDRTGRRKPFVIAASLVALKPAL